MSLQTSHLLPDLWPGILTDPLTRRLVAMVSRGDAALLPPPPDGVPLCSILYPIIETGLVPLVYWWWETRPNRREPPARSAGDPSYEHALRVGQPRIAKLLAGLYDVTAETRAAESARIRDYPCDYPLSTLRDMSTSFRAEHIVELLLRGEDASVANANHLLPLFAESPETYIKCARDLIYGGAWRSLNVLWSADCVIPWHEELATSCMAEKTLYGPIKRHSDFLYRNQKPPGPAMTTFRQHLRVKRTEHRQRQQHRRQDYATVINKIMLLETERDRDGIPPDVLRRGAKELKRARQTIRSIRLAMDYSGESEDSCSED